MPLFTKKESELESHRDKWCYFLKNLDDFDSIPDILREPIFERAFETAEYINLPPKEQQRYDAELKIYRDNYAAMKTAVDDSFAKGEAKGKAKGRIEGRIEGEIKSILRTLTKRFKQVPKTVEKSLLAVNNIEHLEKLADFAYDCKTFDEFKKALKE
jgi:hypothetical protein